MNNGEILKQLLQNANPQTERWRNLADVGVTGNRLAPVTSTRLVLWAQGQRTRAATLTAPYVAEARAPARGWRGRRGAPPAGSDSAFRRRARTLRASAQQCHGDCAPETAGLLEN